MSYFWKGNLCGRICKDCIEPLSNLVVRVYRPRKEQLRNEISDTFLKTSLAILKESDVNAKEEYLLTKANIDINGDVTIELSENYGGGPIEVDIYAGSVPGQKRQKKLPPPRQLTLGVIQPEWDQQESGIFGRFKYCISARLWCAFRALFDAWVICGRVVACADNSQPVGGVKVIACDTDYFQDDRLGDALTNAEGFFRIDYTSADFKRTLLSPIINVETPFPPFNTGPDVYFRIETNEAVPTVLLNEPRSAGRQPGRENVWNCLCVQLCAEVEVPDDGIITIPTVWTQVGNTFTIPAGGLLNDFNTDGFGISGSTAFAFHGVVRLLGGAPRIQNGHPVEYRFLMSDSTTPNNAAPPPSSTFTRIVGVGADTNVFFESTNGKFKVGQMIRFSPYKVVDIFARRAELDADGWLDVNNSIENTFVARPDLNPAELTTPGLWQWKSADFLMALNTHQLTSELDVPNTIVNPGQAVPAANRIAQEQIAIRFEAREVVNKATNSFIALPGSGQTLNIMVINNNPAFHRVAIAQHLTANSCDALSGPVSIAYTSYHPYLRSVNLHIRSNNYAINTGLTDPGQIPLPTPLPDEVFNAGLPVASPGPLTPLHKCTYLVTLSTQLRLHNGDGAQDTSMRQTVFYYEP